MKTIFKMTMILLIAVSLVSCGNKRSAFSKEELEEIHNNEKLLRERLVNKTWHYYDEPNRAVLYLEDGSHINYLSAGIRGADVFTSDEEIWNVAYCDFEGNSKYLEEEADKQRALKYYDYNVTVRYTNSEGKDKCYTLKIEFDGDDLILANDRLYEGRGVIEHMPEDLGIYEDLTSHVIEIEGLTNYALFYADGYCFMTYGVFMDGSTNGAYLYRWGYDKEKKMIYLMDHYEPEEGQRYEDVREYILEKDDDTSYRFVDTWSDGVNSYSVRIVDGMDDSAIALMNSYDTLHKWTIEHFDNY